MCCSGYNRGGWSLVPKDILIYVSIRASFAANKPDYFGFSWNPVYLDFLLAQYFNPDCRLMQFFSDSCVK